MKVLVCVAPGKFEYNEIKEPAHIDERSILKIKRIGVCGTDLHAFEGTQPYFTYPRILGHELAAEIVETDRPGFTKGELVTIMPYFSCGHCIACRNGKPNCCESLQVFGVHIDGGMTEYISVPNYSLLHAHGLGVDALSLVEPFAVGAHAIRRADIRPEEFVLVAGAGPIGLGVAALAKIAGGNVIMMDTNQYRVDFARGHAGVSYTINPTKENPTERLREITNGDMPTIVIDATGNQQAINNLFQYMAHGAKYILVGLQKKPIAVDHPEFHKREGTLMSSRNATLQDFEQVITCMQKRLINPSDYITHRIPFSEAAERFGKLLDPKENVIKASIGM